MRVTTLKEYPEYAEEVSQWTNNQWGDGTKKDFQKRYKKSLDRINNTKPPLLLVASDNQQCNGTVSLIEKRIKNKDATLWLSALFVPNDKRRQGIGRLLVEEAVQEARKLQYKKLYLQTKNQRNFYEKLGWVFIKESKKSNGLKTDLMYFDL